jgi:hypothetical protein
VARSSTSACTCWRALPCAREESNGQAWRPPQGVYTNAEIFASYTNAIKRFLDRGGVIVWGIVPTGFEGFAREEIPSLVHRLESVWKVLWSKSIDREQLTARSMLSPATCCLVNPDKEQTVERAFAAVNRMADVLKTKYL